MNIEYEATFVNVDKEDIRSRLKALNAELRRPEFFQKRIVLDMPPERDIKGGFMRVRDEGDKVTLTFKIVDGGKITDQHETVVTVNDYDSTVFILTTLGCIPRAYEETYRELWVIDNVEVTIDTWPFLGPIVEVEAKSEEGARSVSEKLGFKWEDAKFCTAGTLYKEKYGMGPVDVSKKTGKVTQLTFKGENPFLLDK
jgi:adenylate cyclase, class 2